MIKQGDGQLERVGRFEFEPPAEMAREAEQYMLRYCEVSEAPLPAGGEIEACEALWAAEMGKIATEVPPPDGYETRMIEVEDLDGEWFRQAVYFADEMTDQEILIRALRRVGPVGLWVEIYGRRDARELIEQLAREVATAYEPFDENSAHGTDTTDRFYLRRGSVWLPYLEQERAYCRYVQHPLNLTIRLETEATHEVDEAGVTDRWEAAIGSAGAMGVGVNRIRSRSRTINGLNGEEAVLRLTENDRAEIHFEWLYSGEADSGYRPRVSLSMESSADTLDEKLSIWDRILESLRPVEEPRDN